MAATLQSQTVSVINNLILAGQQLTAIKTLIDQNSAIFTQLTLGTPIAVQATAPFAADGSLGTADGSPNVAHPIDTRVLTALTRAISSNDVASLLTGLQAVSLLIGGSAATQQGQLPQLLAKLAGG